MTQPISMSSVLKVAPSIAARELQGEIVLLNLESGTYFGLDATGTSIWRLIDRHGDLQRVFDEMAAEYDVAAVDLRRDLLSLARQLVERGLLELAQAGEAHR